MNDTTRHIHCWHTTDRFSKFHLSDGTYKKLDLTEFAEMKTIRDYATTIAVSADRMSDEELKYFTLNETSMSEKLWIKRSP